MDFAKIYGYGITSDSLEIIQAKTCRLFGKLNSFLMVTKSLSSSYTKDLEVNC